MNLAKLHQGHLLWRHGNDAAVPLRFVEEMLDEIGFAPTLAANMRYGPANAAHARRQSAITLPADAARRLEVVEPDITKVVPWARPAACHHVTWRKTFVPRFMERDENVSAKPRRCDQYPWTVCARTSRERRIERRRGCTDAPSPILRQPPFHSAWTARAPASPHQGAARRDQPSHTGLIRRDFPPSRRGGYCDVRFTHFGRVG